MRCFRKLVPLIVLLLLWWLASSLSVRQGQETGDGVGQPATAYRLIPTPWETGREGARLASTGELCRHLSLTVFRGMCGLVLGLAIALILGVPCGLLRPVMEVLSPLVTAMQSCPPIIWISFLLVWAGIGNVVPMLVVFAAVFPPCFLNVAQGVAGLDHRLLEMTRVYRVPRGRVLRQIVLPGISRFAVASLSFALGITWKVTATAEFFGAPSGVGERIYWSQREMNMPRLFAWTAVIIAVGVALELGVVQPLREALDPEKGGGDSDRS